jgi:predicted MFS family arabinose efflux permease
MSELQPVVGHSTECANASTISGAQTLLFALAVGVIVTNLFASQTLVGPIGATFGMAQAYEGLIAMATLLGYAVGLFLLVPLGDLLENRALTVRLVVCATLAATAVALAPTAALLLLFLFALGVACAGIQILVPLAASLAEPQRRGRVIGDVMSGLMAGILLSRPLASFVASIADWRVFYGLNALCMVLLACLLAFRLPRVLPTVSVRYPALIASLWHLLRREPVLRRRALTASISMAAFSLFWTSVALRLSQAPFFLDQRAVALFALAGAGGVVATPLAGRAGDRGWTRLGTIVSHLSMIVAFAIAAWAGEAARMHWLMPLGLMVAGAILLDMGVTGDQTLGRRDINLLQAEARGRINGLFVGLFFLGGAAGSTVAGIAWASGGWAAICLAGLAFGIANLFVDLWHWPG